MSEILTFKITMSDARDNVEEAFTNNYGTWNFHLETIDERYFKFLLVLEPTIPQTEQALKGLKVDVKVSFLESCYYDDDDDEEDPEDYDPYAIEVTANQFGNLPVYEAWDSSHRLEEGVQDFTAKIRIDASSLQIPIIISSESESE